MEILIDFDGTCTKHDFPRVGEDIGAIPVLKELVKNGHNLILFTMRSDVVDVFSPEFEGKFTGTYLTDAVKWFEDNKIPLYGIQVNPTQHEWTTSPKAYGQLIIDDIALGIPLIHNKDERPYVDWEKVRIILIEKNIIKNE